MDNKFLHFAKRHVLSSIVIILFTVLALAENESAFVIIGLIFAAGVFWYEILFGFARQHFKNLDNFKKELDSRKQK